MLNLKNQSEAEAHIGNQWFNAVHSEVCPIFQLATHFMTKSLIAFIVSILMVSQVNAESSTTNSGCQHAHTTIEQIDFDSPKERLQRYNGLTIPQDARIRDIIIVTRDIFHFPKENQGNWLEQTMNALHPKTHNVAIKSQLLFRKGDPFEREKLTESERILRKKVYLFDAWIAPIRVCENQVDIAVVTRDLWTLKPNFGYSRSGGNTETTIGLSDDNFLGLGKHLSFNQEKGAQRTSYVFNYVDPNLLGSRWQASLATADTDDGNFNIVHLERPFYKIGARWSAGFSYRDQSLNDDLYFRGNAVNEFKRDLTSYGVFGGLSLGVQDNTENRILFGYRFIEQQFSPTNNTQGIQTLADDRTLSYPWIGFNHAENHFIKTINLNKIQQVEDISIGREFDIKIGWSDKQWRADQDRLVVNQFYRDTLIATDNHYSTLYIGQEGVWNADTHQPENMQYYLNWKYHNRGQSKQFSWYANLTLTRAARQTTDQELSIGGNSGLRGYPLRYQIGDRRYLFTLERRYYSNWYPFRIFRLGGLVFFDAGRAWFAHQDNGYNGGPLSNIGYGIRLTSSRIEVARVLQVDIAHPLQRDKDEELDSFEIIISGNLSF